MHGFMLFTITMVMTTDYFAIQGWIPGPLKFLPEIVSGLTMIFVIALGVKNQFRYVRPAYWFTFTAILIVIICGAVANELGSGPMVAGIRSYLRAIPLFLLPAVYAFTEQQVRSQMTLVLVLALPQLYVGLQQRAAEAAINISGDVVRGTLGGSGWLSVFLICVACGLVAAYMRKRLSLLPFVVLLILVLAPTTINETKVTVILLPLGLFCTFVLGSKTGARLKNALLATGLLALFAAIFIPVYNFYVADREYAPEIGDFFSDKETIEQYMGGKAEIGAKSTKVGRTDALLIPLREVSHEPVGFAFGLGVGNASHSQLGKQFIGRYNSRYEPFLQSVASVTMLEIGIGGLFLVMVLYWLIYRDSRVLAKQSDTFGLLGLAWSGVVAIMVVATFYTEMIASKALSYLFWYFSGIVAAHRMRLSYHENPRGT